MKVLFMPHTVNHYNIGLLSTLSNHVSIYTSYNLEKTRIFKRTLLHMKGKKFILKSFDYLFSPFVDIVHANSAFQADPVWKAKRTIITSHGFPLPQIEIDPKYKKYYYKELQKLKELYNEGVPIISISKFTEEMLERLYNINSFSIVYHGVLPSFFINRKNVHSNKVILLYISRLHPFKEPFILLKAFDKISRELNNVELVIKGNGPLLKDVLKFCVKKKLLDKVRLITRKLPFYEFINLFRYAHIFIHTARLEPFGLVVLEAMATGLPVIVPKMGGTYEVAGSAGIHFCPGDFNDLSEKILKTIYDKKFRYSKSIKSIRRARIFTWEKSAKKYLKIYISLVS
ncbi:MAG: glycosyltransferase family 4 protein [Thermoproteales archaeon]|nr:glycosyltransferase family 4 protein [Thermoproteales archaeon]